MALEGPKMASGVSAVSIVGSLLPAVAVPLIVGLFYLDGLVVGKVTPPAALFVAYVAVSTPDRWSLAALSAACVAASTLGQWTLYRGFNGERPTILGLRRRFGVLDRLPRSIRRGVGERRMLLVSRNFSRFGGVGLAVTNSVPVVRGLMSIPAGMSRYPVGRFLAFSTVGNVAYVTLLVLVAKGLVTTVQFVP